MTGLAVVDCAIAAPTVPGAAEPCADFTGCDISNTMKTMPASNNATAIMGS